ncbi:MAG TPA: hypothetical protein VJ201_09360, partial [Candidatus Babeliales bacterium]|nr:hypothetical protein [Candidatus Babeliales bacterium]
MFNYNTHVATIDRINKKLYVHGYWSTTTSKHINHVADVMGLEKVKQEQKQEAQEQIVDKTITADDLKSIATIAMLGDVLGKSQKESNDWKTRMLKAGLEGKGLIMPDDWDTLSEDTKEARLNGALSQLK